MTFKNLTEKRFSARAYTPEHIEREKIDYILDCARLAPSAANNQPWHFYVITSETDKFEVQKSYNKEWFRDAPIYIIACGNSQEAWKRSNYDNKCFVDVDIAIACEHLCLAASEQGLGSCWVCNFDPEIISKFLDLPEHIAPLAIFSVGYPDKSVKAPTKKRKELHEIATWK